MQIGTPPTEAGLERPALRVMQLAGRRGAKAPAGAWSEPVSFWERGEGERSRDPERPDASSGTSRWRVMESPATIG